QVYRRYGEFVSRARSGNHLPGEHKRPPQQASRMGHVAFGNLAANHGAGNDFAVIVDGRNGDDLKPSFAPQPAQEMNVAGLAVAEAEIFSHENGPNQEIVYQDL